MRLNELGGISLMTRSCQEIHCSRLRGLGLWFALVGLLAWPYYFGVPALAEEAESAQLVGAADLMANLEAVEQAFSRIVEQVSPCVVGIRARRYESSSPYERGGYATQNGFEQTVTINGSGVVLRPDGSILTNEHVVRGADEVEIILRDGSRRVGQVVAADPRADLAVVRTEPDGLVPARIAEWDNVRRGQWSIAVGNPFGLGYDGNLSVSVGVISNLNRRLPGLGEVEDRLYADMIQTTASIHPGNSGGPLFNMRGEVVGIVTAVHSRGIDDEGIGFAIPMSPARRQLIDMLAAGKPVEHGFLGLIVRELNPNERMAAGLSPDVGVWVDRVEPNGPADAAGIRPHDIIVRYDGRLVEAPMQFADCVGLTPIGQQVTLEIIRRNQSLTLQATLDRRQSSRVQSIRGASALWRGLHHGSDLASDAEAVQDL
jgi:S1-C subfamily serine protease